MALYIFNLAVSQRLVANVFEKNVQQLVKKSCHQQYKVYPKGDSLTAINESPFGYTLYCW